MWIYIITKQYVYCFLNEISIVPFPVTSISGTTGMSLLWRQHEQDYEELSAFLDCVADENMKKKSQTSR